MEKGSVQLAGPVHSLNAVYMNGQAAATLPHRSLFLGKIRHAVLHVFTLCCDVRDFMKKQMCCYIAMCLVVNNA